MEFYDNHVDSCKRHRMDIMDEYLTSIGHKRKPIPKDGSSLFRAVSEQLFATQHHHIQVRKSCVAHMRRRKEDFEHFVDDSFDEYLERMCNPKEWGDQLEISALSQLYKCEFYIYEQPGHTAKNVTENYFEKEVTLCHSGQKHYDSIINSVLLKNVLSMNKQDEKKAIQTFRMLCSSDTEQLNKDKKAKNHVEDFPFSLLYEPSIGTFDKSVAAQLQCGLAFKLPITLDFVRSLDPSVCRNIDYDFWIAIKRRQQFIDFSIAEGLQYCIGDRCLVCLNIYSKPLIGHVQEVSPNNGPITVFIEALGERHTIAIKNIKPIDSYSNGCRSEMPHFRSKRSFNDNCWGSKSRRYQRYSCKNGLKSDKSHASATLNENNNNNNGNRSNRTQSSESGTSQQRKYNYSKRLSKSPNGKGKQIKNQSWDENQAKTGSKGKHKWSSAANHPSAPTYSPTRTLRHMSINQDNFTEEQWPSSDANNGEAAYMLQSYRADLEWEEGATAYGYCLSSEHSRVEHEALQQHSTESIALDSSYWVNQEESEPCASYFLEKTDPDANGDNENEYSSQVVPTTQDSEEGVLRCDDNNQASLEPPCGGCSTSVAVCSNTQQQDGTDDTGQAYQPAVYHYAQPSDVYVPYVPSFASNYPCGSAPPMASPRPSFTGPITVVDNEGKEMLLVDDKNPLQFFYNLGLEYYRQLQSGSPRNAPLLCGSAPLPSNAYGTPPQPSIVHPHPVGFLPPGNPPIAPSMTQMHSSCVPLPHFHSVVSAPPGGAMHFPVPPGRFLVQIPPPPVPPSPAQSSVIMSMPTSQPIRTSHVMSQITNHTHVLQLPCHH